MANSNVLPDYERGDLIGRGTYGFTYAGTAPNGDEVAIKQMWLMTSTADDDFAAEVEILRNLNGRAAPRYITSDKDSDTGAIVMEKLGSFVMERNSLEKAYDALSILHDNGVFHNDAYLRNVMMRGKEVVFIDFGMSILFNGPVPLPLRYADLVSFTFGHVKDDLSRWVAGFHHMSMISVNDLWNRLIRYLLSKNMYNPELLAWAYRARVSDSFEAGGPLPMMRKLPISRSIYDYIDQLRWQRSALTSPTSERRLQRPSSPIRVWVDQSSSYKADLPPR